MSERVENHIRTLEYQRPDGDLIPFDMAKTMVAGNLRHYDAEIVAPLAALLDEYRKLYEKNIKLSDVELASVVKHGRSESPFEADLMAATAPVASISIQHLVRQRDAALAVLKAIAEIQETVSYQQRFHEAQQLADDFLAAQEKP